MADQGVTESGRTIGYARVSSAGKQELTLQLDALMKHGVAKDLLFTDRMSGAKERRPGLNACLAELQTGDVLVVWRLDRLGDGRTLVRKDFLTGVKSAVRGDQPILSSEYL